MKAIERNFDELHVELVKVWGKDEKMIDYVAKGVSTLVMLRDGYMVSFEQPSIEKEFWFGYSDFGQGLSYDENEERCDNVRKNIEKYFFDYNLSRADYDKKIEALKDSNKNLYFAVRYYSGEKLLYYLCMSQAEKERGFCSYEDYTITFDDDAEIRKALIEALEAEKAKFEKRLRTWWRKYGEKYCRVESFWVDR